jgi:tetratricopeptide (TPR) repeat protein
MLHSAFWLEWQLWQDRTFAYHLANVLQHAIAACLFWAILRRLAIPGAYLAAAIFALHPVNTESVAWITEQKNTLSAVFYLAAAWCYLRFDDPAALSGPIASRRPVGWYLFALLLFVLGLLTKTVVATLPAALLVVIWWRRGRVDLRGDVLPLAPWFALGGAAGAFTAWYEKFVIGAQGAAFEIGALERLLLAGRVVWFYLSKLVWPADLIFFYPRWEIDAASPVWWISLTALAALLVVLVVVAVRHGGRAGGRAPLAAMLFFVGTLFPVLGFLDVYPFRFSFVADHFQYLAQLGIIALVAGGLTWMARGWWAPRVRVLTGAAAIGLATLGWLTWKQSHQYGRDAIHHYRSILDQNPGAWIAYANWGGELMLQGDHAAAVPLLRKALEVHPDYYEAHRDLAVTYDRLSRPAEALPHYERAARLDPDPKRGHNMYGNALLRARRFEDAIARLERAIELAEEEQSPIYTFYVDLGRAYVSVGRWDDALVQLRRARERAGPEYPLPGADALMSDALIRLGRTREAEPHLRRAVAEDPADAIHRFDLGKLLYDTGRYAEARRYLLEAIERRPDLVDAYIALALAHHAEGRWTDAQAAAVQALEVAQGLLPPDAVRSIEGLLAPVLGR